MTPRYMPITIVSRTLRCVLECGRGAKRSCRFGCGGEVGLKRFVRDVGGVAKSGSFAAAVQNGSGGPVTAFERAPATGGSSVCTTGLESADRSAHSKARGVLRQFQPPVSEA